MGYKFKSLYTQQKQCINNVFKCSYIQLFLNFEYMIHIKVQGAKKLMVSVYNLFLQQQKKRTGLLKNQKERTFLDILNWRE